MSFQMEMHLDVQWILRGKFWGLLYQECNMGCQDHMLFIGVSGTSWILSFCLLGIYRKDIAEISKRRFKANLYANK